MDIIQRLTQAMALQHPQAFSELCRDALTELEAFRRERLEMQTRIDAYLETIRVIEKSQSNTLYIDQQNIALREMIAGGNYHELLRRQLEALESIAKSLNSIDQHGVHVVREHGPKEVHWNDAGKPLCGVSSSSLTSNLAELNCRRCYAIFK